MADNDALMLVFTRNAFYKRLHYLALAAFALMLIVIGILIAILIFLIRHPTPPLYFATNEIGELINTVPLSMPNMSTDEVIAWTTDAIQTAYSYDFVNYHSQLQNAEKYFTQYGWNNYIQALNASNNLLALTERKQIVIAQIVGSPKLLAQGILGGAYAWKFEFPVLMTYWEPPFDDKHKFLNALSVNIIVQRQPVLQSYKGLGVIQMIAVMPTQSNQPQEISEAAE